MAPAVEPQIPSFLRQFGGGLALVIVGAVVSAGVATYTTNTRLEAVGLEVARRLVELEAGERMRTERIADHEARLRTLENVALEMRDFRRELSDARAQVAATGASVQALGKQVDELIRVVQLQRASQGDSVLRVPG